VPEGDTIFRAARTLNAALSGKVVTGFETVLPFLSRVHVDTPVTGRTVEGVTSHGKWILMRFSGDLILLTHMLMSGSWHIYRPGERWQRRRDDMRIIVSTPNIRAVAFKVPVAEFHSSKSLEGRPGFKNLGQDILAADFNEKIAAEHLRSQPDLEIGEALLKQSLLAGIGNVYKSEVCFACGINPYRNTGTLTEDEAQCLVATAARFLRANVNETSGKQIVTYSGLRRTTGRSNAGDRLWVYGRVGEPCRKCGTAIRKHRQGQGARVTFWCPNCQH
jgi:endonuclease VIII